MTDPRRAAEGVTPQDEATRDHVLDQMRAADAPLAEFVVAGGLRGFRPSDMFPEAAA